MTRTVNTRFDVRAANRCQQVDLCDFCSLPRDEVRDLALDKLVLELCNHYEQLTLAAFDGYDGKSGYCGVHAPACLTVDLGALAAGEERDVGLIRLLLFDSVVDNNHGDRERLYYYRVLVAEDFATERRDKDAWEWRVVADLTRCGTRNWQFIRIPGGLRRVRYIRIHCVGSLKNSGFHIVRLGAYAERVAAAVDYGRLMEHLRRDPAVPAPDGTLRPIDPCGKAQYVCVEGSPEIEVGDGFPLSKRIYDTMNFVQLIADRDARIRRILDEARRTIRDKGRLRDDARRGGAAEASSAQGMTFEIEARHLEGINTTISKKIEAFRCGEHGDRVRLDWRSIYQILASIADDIAIVEQDPKNMERVVLDPVNGQLDEGYRQDRSSFVWSVVAMVLPYLLGLLVHRFF